MYPCNSRMRHPTGLMGVYLPLDSTIAKQILSPGLKASLSMRNTPRSPQLFRWSPLRKACSRLFAPLVGGKKSFNVFHLGPVWGVTLFNRTIVLLFFKTPSINLFNTFLLESNTHENRNGSRCRVCLYLHSAVLLHTCIHTLSEMRLMELCALSIRPIELVVDHLFLNLFPLFSPIKNEVIYCDINHINKAD